ncbi:MAG: AGE family epimerase/isomerase [Planctomycetota bacterium]
MNCKPFDAGWFRTYLLHDLLPHWLEAATTDEGLFLPNLDRQWRHVGEPVGTAVSQGRMLHNLAIGFDLTGDEAYRDALRVGARFLLDGFRDPEHGGWFHAVGPGGAVVDDHKDAYDLAFVVLGLAHASRATDEPDFRAGMAEAWDLLDSRFRDEHGGFMRKLTRTFEPNEDRRTQNPTMHLFEALLAAGDVDPAMLDRAEQVGRFVLNRLVHWDGQPCLPEYFDLDWAELPRERGGCCILGHQFEWAFLFSYATEKGLPSWWVMPATDLLQFGLRCGRDPDDGGIRTAAMPDASIVSPDKGWWEQCEAVRAMLHHAVRHGRPDLWRPFDQTLDFVKTHFVDTEYGGYYNRPTTSPTETEPTKGGGAKVDYHVVGMCAEAVRLAEQAE